MLVLKTQIKPLKGIISKPTTMYVDDWNELNLLGRSTTKLNLAETVYFIVVNQKITKALWKKLCATYEKETTFNKLYLMRRLFELQMKESIASHLNELCIIFGEL